MRNIVVKDTRIEPSIRIRELSTGISKYTKSLFISIKEPRANKFSHRLASTIMSKLRKRLRNYAEGPINTLVKIKLIGRKLKEENIIYSMLILAHTDLPVIIQEINEYLREKLSAIFVPLIRLEYDKRNKTYSAKVIATLLTGYRSSAMNFKGYDYLSLVLVPLIVASNPPQQELMDNLSSYIQAAWNFTLVNGGGRFLRNFIGIKGSISKVKYYKRIILVFYIYEQQQEPYVEVKVSEGFEGVSIKVPIRNPMWKLENLPPKLREDIFTIIVNPYISKAPYAPRGMLITGPAGVGKTVAAEAIADALKLKVVEIRPSIYRSMWYGMTEKILDAVLRNVKKRKDVMILIDDAEFITGRHVTYHETHVSEITIFLNYLQDPTRPFIVMTANTPELIDPAILRPGRIDVVVLIGFPDREMRRLVAKKSCEKYNIEIDEETLNDIVRMSRWFTNAEIDAFIRLAASKGNGKITYEALEWARRRFNINEGIRRSIQDQLRWYVSKFQGVVISYVPEENIM